MTNTAPPSIQRGPERLARFVLTLAGLWLLVIFPALNYWAPERLLPHMGTGETVDFGSYFSGALVARYGLWRDLYPRPKPGIYDVPPTVTPRFPNRFFDPSTPGKRMGQWAYYPSIASKDSSNVSPELLAHAPELANDWRYIYPPPLALLVAPLAWLDYDTGGRGVWFWLMCASFFGVAVLNVRLYGLFCPQPGYSLALVAFLPVLPTFTGSLYTAFPMGNVTPALGFFITAIAYAWMRSCETLLGLLLIPTLLFKGIGLPWCFQFVLSRPVKWKALASLGAVTLILNFTVLSLAGLEPYRLFFREVLPKAEIAMGTGIQGELFSRFCLSLPKWFLALRVILSAGLVYLFYRRSGESDSQLRLANIAALIAGTMAVYCLFNPVVWPHYYPNYLLFPSLAWLCWEAHRPETRWRRATAVMIALNFLILLDGCLFTDQSWLIAALQSHGHYTAWMAKLQAIVIRFTYQALPHLEAGFILVLAYRRLFPAPPLPPNSAPAT